MVDEQHAGAGPTTPGTEAEEARAHDDALADEMEEESFPGSDPPSTWAGHDRPAPDVS
ncbi:hypothetical protein ACK8HX_08285 [Oryzobacter sp. R7]|uniref:hypothetical protein n=1 Tax=Oryzobacter faecalis TaxID=3388656 RepID=UPI00398CC12E